MLSDILEGLTNTHLGEMPLVSGVSTSEAQKTLGGDLMKAASLALGFALST